MEIKVMRPSSTTNVSVRRSRRLAVVATIVAAAVGACGVTADSGTRQEAVAERGREVMPFDLDATTHRFVPVTDGLVQTVVADDPTDRRQVDLVRSHLRAEAARFERGDFGDPARIHGDDMPGLARLREHRGAVVVGYRSIGGGGEITYRTQDPELVAALHAWARAQTTDHGEHADG